MTCSEKVLQADDENNKMIKSHGERFKYGDRYNQYV